MKAELTIDHTPTLRFTINQNVKARAGEMVVIHAGVISVDFWNDHLSSVEYPMKKQKN